MIKEHSTCSLYQSILSCVLAPVMEDAAADRFVPTADSIRPRFHYDDLDGRFALSSGIDGGV